MSTASQSPVPAPVASDPPPQTPQAATPTPTSSAATPSADDIPPGLWQSYVARGPNLGNGVPVRVTRPPDFVPPPPRPLPASAPTEQPVYQHQHHTIQPQPPSSQPQAHHHSQQTMPSLPPSLSPAPSTPGKMGMPGRPRNKPAIRDPPGVKIEAVPGRFPSPTVDHATANPKFDDDVARLTFAIHQSLPEAVRRAVRDNWEKCVVGSDSHVAFLLNATVHNATPSTLKRAIRDFGAKLVKSSMVDLLEHLCQADIDTVSDIILAKASHKFLDKALDKRLRTIEAKPLINALCRAERLGYEAEDAEDDGDAGQSAAVAAPAQPPNSMPNQPVGPPQTPSAPSPRQDPTQWNCELCYRHFTTLSTYEYHTSKAVCTRVPPSSTGGFKHCCRYCGQGFTTAVGLQYHFNNKVCGDFGAPPVVHPGGAAAGSPQASSPSRSLPASTPQAKYVPMVSTPPSGTPNLLGRTVSGADPYAHLTEHQRLSLNEELRQAELQFAERFRAADAIVDPNERRTRIDGLRNSFGTKQSIIRKKYGVKLRERRTRAEIDAERQRMGITSDMDGTPPAQSRGYNSGMPTAPPHPQQNGTPVAANGNRFSSVNAPVKREMPDDGAGVAPAKRPRTDGEGINLTWVSPTVLRTEPPSAQPPPAQPATAQSASAQPVPAQQTQASAPIEISPSAGTVSRGQSTAASAPIEITPSVGTASRGESAAASDSSGTPDLEAQIEAEAEAAAVASSNAAPAEPSQSIPETTIEVAGEEDDEMEDDDEEEEDDEDEDDDIPAELPTAVRQSFASTNRTG